MFNHGSCLTPSEIEQYVSGSLNEKEKRSVELHIADCMLCSDAIEGFALLSDKNNLPFIVAELNKNVDNKIKKMSPAQAPIIKIFGKRFLSIAASFVLLLGMGFVIKFYLDNSADEKIAEARTLNENTEYKMPVSEDLHDANLDENLTEDKTSPNSKQVQTKPNIAETKKTETLSEQVDNNAPKEIIEESDNVAPKSDEVLAEAEELVLESDEADKNIVEENKKAAINSESIALNKVKSNKIAASSKEQADKINPEPEAEKSVAFMTTRGAPAQRKKSSKKDAEQYKSLRKSALLSYNMKIWNEALSDFNKYLAHVPNDFEIVYKTGMAYFHTKDYNKAIAQFNTVIKKSKSAYVADAQWYLAQSFVQLGDRASAENLLQKIIKQNGKYKKQAKDLLKSLNP